MQIQFSDRPRYIYIGVYIYTYIYTRRVDADAEEWIQHGIPAPSAAAAAVRNARSSPTLPLLFPYSFPTPPPAMPNQIFCNAFAFAFVFSYGFGCETNIKYLFIRLLFGFLSHSLSTPLSLSSPLLLLLFLLSGWHKKSQHAESE